MATKDEIRTWCYKLGDGKLEKNGIEVNVTLKNKPTQFSEFSIRLRPKNREPVEFNLPFMVAVICIGRGKCDTWRERLHAGIAEAIAA
jgi:hypothetical protein